MKHFEHLSLEEFWTRTLQEIDRLHAQTERTEEELSATERNTLLQSIARLRHDGPLADGAEDHVSRIEALLVEAVDRETLGFRGVFDGHNDPDHGAVGIVRAVPILSEQGCVLEGMLQGLRMIAAMRALLSARVDAHRQMALLKEA